MSSGPHGPILRHRFEDPGPFLGLHPHALRLVRLVKVLGDLAGGLGTGLDGF
jgi:hypothetical protein